MKENQQTNLNWITTIAIIGLIFIASILLSMLFHQPGLFQSLLQASFELSVSFLLTLILRFRFADRYKENTFKRYWIIVYTLLTFYSILAPWYFIDALKKSFG